MAYKPHISRSGALLIRGHVLGTFKKHIKAILSKIYKIISEYDPGYIG